MPESIETFVYQFKVVLRQVSPMIWRRLLVRSDSTIADLHYTLQIAWGGATLISTASASTPEILASTAAVARCLMRSPARFSWRVFAFGLGNGFSTNTTLATAGNTTFGWSKSCRSIQNGIYPVCIGGKRSVPPEDCGGAFQFVRLSQQHSLVSGWNLLMELQEAVQAGDSDAVEGQFEEIRELLPWLKLNHFDRRAVNRRLKQYATGDEAWMWEPIGRQA
jgi:hypothetical protein